MKTLFRAKLFDQYIQLAALIIPFIWAVVIKDGSAVFCAYFSVGFVQIVSCLANKWGLDARLKSRMRKAYERWLTVVSVAFGVLLLPSLAGIEVVYIGMFVFAFCMLFVGLGMAIWYFVITAEELKQVRSISRRAAI